MNQILEMFSYAFMRRALIAGILISLSASLIGVVLVLKRNSMIGDGLSHVSFAAIAIATVLGFSPLKFTIPIVILVSFIILKLNENSKVNGDRAIAIISSSSLALGIMAISLTKGVNTDLNSYLFGSILSMSSSDLILSIILSVLIILLFIFFYNKIFAITFDETFAKSTGIKTNFYSIVIAILASITVVLGMRMMGALLISSLIIFPAISSMQVFKTFKSVIISSAIISVFSFIIGLILSYIYAAPTGASIVIINLIIFILLKIFSKIK